LRRLLQNTIRIHLKPRKKPKRKKDAKMHLCQCEGNKTVHPLASIDWVPLADGGHTSVVLNRCLMCFGLTGFPPINFDLILKQGTPDLKAEIQRQFDIDLL
jgi:hypothetical protein